MNFEQSPEFKKDLKRLTKKWRSLPNDIAATQLLITDLYESADEQEFLKQKFFNNRRATRLHVSETVEVVKMRLDVLALGTKDKARIVFVAVKTASLVTFVELYAKNEKPREDPTRYKKWL